MKDLFKGIGRLRHYSAGEILFFEGQESEYLYGIIQGEVRLYKTQQGSITSVQRTLHSFISNQLIAEMPFFMRLPYPANAECVIDSEIISLDFLSFQKALENPSVSMFFINSLCKKVQILESHIAMQNQSLQDRVLKFLETNKTKLHSLSQKQIAISLNIAPESLSRTLRNLKNQGIITTQKGKISFP